MKPKHSPTLEDIVAEDKASPAILKMTRGKISKRQREEDEEIETPSTLDDYFKHIPSNGSGLM
jgi:hypothetical protein